MHKLTSFPVFTKHYTIGKECFIWGRSLFPFWECMLSCIWTPILTQLSIPLSTIFCVHCLFCVFVIKWLPLLWCIWTNKVLLSQATPNKCLWWVFCPFVKWCASYLEKHKRCNLRWILVFEAQTNFFHVSCSNIALQWCCSTSDTWSLLLHL